MAGGNGIVQIEKLDVNERDFDAMIEGGTTALCWAARNGYKEIVELLLKSGASADTIAEANGMVVQIGELDVREGDINISTEDRMTVLQETDINATVMNSRPNMTISKVNMKRGNFNTSIEGGTTALYRAARDGHKEIVELPLKSGASADTIAAANGTVIQIEKVNIERGLLSSAGVLSPVIEGVMTLLHWATRNGHKEIVELLPKSRATVNAMANVDGKIIQIEELDVKEGNVHISNEGR